MAKHGAEMHTNIDALIAEADLRKEITCLAQNMMVTIWQEFRQRQTDPDDGRAAEAEAIERYFEENGQIHNNEYDDDYDPYAQVAAKPEVAQNVAVITAPTTNAATTNKGMRKADSIKGRKR